MGNFGRTLGREVFLLEPEAGTVEQRLDGALGHLQGSRDLAVTQVLKLAEGEHQAVFLGQPLSNGPAPPSSLIRFLDIDRVEAARGGRKLAPQLVVVVIRALQPEVALAAAKLVEAT